MPFHASRAIFAVAELLVLSIATVILSELNDIVVVVVVVDDDDVDDICELRDFNFN